MFDVVLPAGGALPDELARRVGTHAKALIEIDGKTILRRVIEALDDSGLAHRKVLIGSTAVLEHPDAAAIETKLPEGTSGPDNILRGVKWLATQPAHEPRIMVVTTDLPFLTGDIIRRSVELCPAAELTVPLIRRRSWDARFPGSDATFARLADDEWTAGCLYLLDVAAFQRALPHIEAVFQNRKSTFGMARLLGPKFLFKFLTKRLTVPDVEAKIRDMLGCSGSAVVDSPPELAYDIDDWTDLEYARAHIQTKKT